MLSVDEARSRLLGSVSPLGRERVPVRAALGRVLAEALAGVALPRFDTSAMDGYAVRTGDFRRPSLGAWKLPLVGESRAGAAPPPLVRGTAMRIFTGAPLPDGADAVVMQEYAERDGDMVGIAKLPTEGANVRRRGEDLAPSAEAIGRGERLGATKLALAAALGATELVVARRPVVSLLCTGDELHGAGASGDGSGIVESNSFAIVPLAEQAGALVRLLPIARDEPRAMACAIDEALAGSDALVTVGGVGVGDHDLVRKSLVDAGAELDFWSVAMRPGRPLVVGKRGAARVLGLPGTPGGAFVGFALFGVPLLRALQGDTSPVAAPIVARLGRDVGGRIGRTTYLFARTERRAQGLFVEPLENQSSSSTPTLARSDCLAIVGDGTEQLAEGNSVDVLRYTDL